MIEMIKKYRISVDQAMIRANQIIEVFIGQGLNI